MKPYSQHSSASTYILDVNKMHVVPKMHLEHHVKSMKNMENDENHGKNNFVVWPVDTSFALGKKGMLCMWCVALAMNNFFWCFRAAWSPLASGDQEKIFPDQKKIKPNLPLNLDEIGNNFFLDPSVLIFFWSGKKNFWSSTRMWICRSAYSV